MISSKGQKASHHLEDVRSFIKVHRCKEHFISKGRGITPRIGEHLVLLISLSERKRKNCELGEPKRSYLIAALVPADATLPLRLQGRKHDDHGVVPGRGPDKTTEPVPVHLDDGTFGGPFHHLGHLL